MNWKRKTYFILICVPILIIIFPMIVLGETSKIIINLLEKGMNKLKK